MMVTQSLKMMTSIPALTNSCWTVPFSHVAITTVYISLHQLLCTPLTFMLNNTISQATTLITDTDYKGLKQLVTPNAIT